MLIFGLGPRDLFVLDPMGVLYCVPVLRGARGLCEVKEAAYAKFDYSLVSSTTYGIFRFSFVSGELALAYRDSSSIEPMTAFDKERLVFTDGVFRGIRA